MKTDYQVVLPPISATMNGQMFVRDLANRVWAFDRNEHRGCYWVVRM